MSKILVVEDNELNRRLFVDLLTARGHTMWEATDGSQAIELIQKHEPDLVLMDIQLPTISGLDVTQRIRGMTGIHQPKIIAISAFVLKQDAEKALQAGCDDYISKPISIQSFYGAVDKNLKT